MAEGQVTVDGRSYRLPVPFWVVATQNEVDGYGTFPLPQAQQDRFMMALSIGYPSTKEQITILELGEGDDPTVAPVLSAEHIEEAQAEVRHIEVARPIKEYIANILVATRAKPSCISWGQSQGGCAAPTSGTSPGGVAGLLLRVADRHPTPYHPCTRSPNRSLSLIGPGGGHGDQRDPTGCSGTRVGCSRYSLPGVASS